MPGMTISYQVRRTGRRSKNISVRVHQDGSVRVGAPNWASAREINRVVQLHAQWIVERVAEARAVLPSYDDGALHFYVGKRYPLAFAKPSARERDGVEFTGRRFVVTIAERSDERVREAFRRWYRARAGELVGASIARTMPNMPWVKGSPAWRLRRMRSQWGSCTADGNVTLNTQLAKAPLELIDYVVLHEFAHLKHHDHGPGFERLMDRHMPDWRARRRELNALGPAILVE
jgi:predicted metal-dependent hydrolase